MRHNGYAILMGYDRGRPYRFTSADQLLADFEWAVRHTLAERGIGDAVIGEGEATERGTE